MLKIKTNSWVAAGTVAMMGATALVGQPAQAGSKGRRNTMIGLGAVTAYGLLKHNPKVAIVGAAGTAVAYHNYRQAKHGENAREAARQQWYQQRYGRQWRRHYSG